MKLCLLLLLLLLGACATQPKALEPVAANGQGPSRDIHVVSHGKHTGLVIEARVANEAIPEWKQQFGEVNYYEIGWGDAGFYRAESITSRLTLAAVFSPTPSIMHVVAFDENPAIAFPTSEVIRLSIAEANHDNLLRFIASSMEGDEAGVPVHEGRGIYGNSAFYRGVGRYFLCNTCNKWTAKGLYSAGVEVDPVSPISSPDVMKQIRGREGS